jgi:hypothetical protein
MKPVPVRTSIAIGVVGLITLFTSGSFVPAAARSGPALARDNAIARAQVWSPGDISSVDIRTGPSHRDGFPFRATIECRYLDKVIGGRSPKFSCMREPADELKVKYGGNNGEVYGEVAATRLVWALGFGADAMYPVRVMCRGCPVRFGGTARPDGTMLFDPASVERKMAGTDFPAVSGWSWEELDKVDEEAGGAPRAHRDAL